MRYVLADWSLSRHWLEDGRIDVIGTIPQSAENQASMALSPGMLDLDMYIFYRIGAPPRHMLIRGKLVRQEGDDLIAEGIAIDVTALVEAEKALKQEEEELRITQERLTEARRLAALGDLAGGIAHDFNNMLGVILGYATFIEEDSGELPSIHRHAVRILGATRRGKSLVEQILTLTGRRGKHPVRIPLADLVAATVTALENNIPAGATLHVLPDSAATEVKADRKQLGAALHNLCVNGLEALNGKSGAATVAIRSPDLDSEPFRRLRERNSPDLAPIIEVWHDDDGTVWAVTGHAAISGNWVALAVSDSSTGMDAALLEQAFSPFFTTRERARNTGLGLSVVQGVVLAHGGAVVIRSRSGEGTTVEIILPGTGT